MFWKLSTTPLTATSARRGDARRVRAYVVAGQLAVFSTPVAVVGAVLGRREEKARLRGTAFPTGYPQTRSRTDFVVNII